MKHYKNCSQILTLDKAVQKGGRLLKPEDIGIIENASIVFNDDEILWVGPTEQVPQEYQSIQATDLKGKVVTPAIIDSHTHIVFGGNRADEYAMRLNGADYVEIAKAGGGILSTMNATREASEDELFAKGVERIQKLVNIGVKTIEIKSGYGLDYENELKLSRVISKLKEHVAGNGINILRTYLAAHAVPKNYDSSKDYMNQVVMPLLKQVHKEDLIDFVDIFHEEGYFTKDDTIQLFEEAQKLGIKIKIHADEFNDNGGAELAIKYKAASCDHLLKTSLDTIKKFKDSDTVATILPGTAMFLGKGFASVQNFFEQGAIVSFASDYNPGSCHCFNLLQIVSSAAPALKINQTQLWAGITLNAAKSLGLSKLGAIKTGFTPSFSVFNCSKVSEITYHWGENLFDPTI